MIETIQTKHYSQKDITIPLVRLSFAATHWVVVKTFLSWTESINEVKFGHHFDISHLLVFQVGANTAPQRGIDKVVDVPGPKDGFDS
jgi:hypothetical protein